MRKVKFAKNKIYHIYNRGVEKRNIFLENSDYLRFINDLFEFNDLTAVLPSNQRFSIRLPKQLQSFTLEQCLEAKPLNKHNLVDIVSFALMPNHFHLVLKQTEENGVAKFMQKLGTGYTVYFNQKYNRVGSLFQGSYKAVHIINESHFIHIPFYIHANPLDLKFPQWRKNKINNTQEALKFLENYRWSSFRDYIGKKTFPLVTQKNLMIGYFGGTKNYYHEFSRWLNDMKIADINPFLLE